MIAASFSLANETNHLIKKSIRGHPTTKITDKIIFLFVSLKKSFQFKKTPFLFLLIEPYKKLFLIKTIPKRNHNFIFNICIALPIVASDASIKLSLSVGWGCIVRAKSSIVEFIFIAKDASLIRSDASLPTI